MLWEHKDTTSKEGSWDSVPEERPLWVFSEELLGRPSGGLCMLQASGLISASSSILASMGSRDCNSFISFSLWVGIQERVSSSLGSHESTCLAERRGLQIPHKCSDSREGNSSPLFIKTSHQLCWFLDIFSITVVFYVHI